MTLDKFRPLADRALGPFVSAAKVAGLSPNGVSVIAFLLALGAGGVYAVAAQDPLLYLGGAVLVFLNGWLDLVDGALARELNVASSGGDLLDHVLDRYADIGIIVGLAAGVSQWELGIAAVTGVLMTSYLGTQAQAVGLDRVYGGLLGRADRLALVGVVTGVAAFVPNALAGLTLVGWLLVVFAVVGHVTAAQRFYHAMGALE
ncbi:CDP-alcohol phosphatidyltransferase family protein [Haloarcula argentinensis]|uniref:CDP-alcohol phosphatidyltransferase family protein n=1 Tax=Haloarcula argentinensis TaxID=43776 RepID=A0A830FQL7_HALAR|nr:CDP-alcohol phosphatidyltransferase family protein [Haloarcula argentinensis]EMA23444.1 CDP-diacylglycerol-glycerol-3-phosphate 3-phosphatidyltransferase [Haloarcula argentinensis DSM 12282]MDS0252950.1 CDP-alcohol phosphatidyltransferase family protein [Haloarcula argentinensis]GGM28200.1 CDP-diacylglycerol--glycerol-3-phosphate 3-phosphatidyltransferase [Haloarcula argentinensis]